MTDGFDVALREITLVLFTTLAPVAVFSCVLISLILMSDLPNAKERSRIEHMTAIPLVIAMVGLIASATHLGTPSNALYVLSGIGRSPLSTEVACAVAFLSSSGLCWLYSFATKPKRIIMRIWHGVNIVSGLLCIGSIALAYSEPTILTWNTPYVPLNIWLAALAGGPLLAAATLHSAHAISRIQKFLKPLFGISFVAFVANIIVLALQNEHLYTLRNGAGVANELVPHYPLMILLYAVCGLAAYALIAASLLRGKDLTGTNLFLGSLAFLVGLFIVRIGFYMMHMTTGISI